MSNEIETIIDVKVAVRIAAEYIRKLYENESLRDLLLEEVSLSEDGSLWYVTMGFSRTLEPRPSPFGNALENLMSPKEERVYKIFEIDSLSGEVKAMKIRET